MAVCNLACEGLSGSSTTPDLAQRKLYIGGLSPDISSEMLLNFFGRYGDIEEGSVAYDKDTNESRLVTFLHFIRILPSPLASIIFLSYWTHIRRSYKVIGISLCVEGLDLLLIPQ